VLSTVHAGDELRWRLNHLEPFLVSAYRIPRTPLLKAHFTRQAQKSCGELASFHEAAQVAFPDLRQARRNVIQIAFTHPFFEAAHQVEKVFERIHDKQ